jgi:WhiB family redox-sensing transcriptional regulator
VTAMADRAFVLTLMDRHDGPVGVEELLSRPEWMEWGACVGVDRSAFFPGRGDDVRPAKALCAVCRVQYECLSYAVADDTIVGIWGGTSGRERRRLRSASRMAS